MSVQHLVAFQDGANRVFSPCRMDRLSFDRVVQLLENHPLTRQIFISTNRSKAQRPVYVQLLAFLGYNAFPDTNAIIVTFTLGLGHGTLALYRRRVSRALRSLSTEFVKWPDLEERAVLRAKYGDMFEGMLGIVDGSLIEMAEIPRVDGAWYYSGRKKLYGVRLLPLFSVARKARWLTSFSSLRSSTYNVYAVAIEASFPTRLATRQLPPMRACSASRRS